MIRMMLQPQPFPTSHATIYHTKHSKPNITPRTKISSFLTNSDYILRPTIDLEEDMSQKTDEIII